MMKKHWGRLLFGFTCLLLLLGHAGQVWRIPLVSAFDAYLYDVRLRLTMPSTLDERVVIVDIDERSLNEIGRWPWGRNLMADLSRRLTDDYRVAVLGFDVVFAEADESSGLRVLEALGRQRFSQQSAFQAVLPALRAELDYDRRFAEALTGRPVVLGYYFSNLGDAQQTGQLPVPSLMPEAMRERRADFVTWRGYGANLPRLQAAAADAGHIVSLVDEDGRARRVPLLVDYEGAYYQAFALAVVRTLLGGGTLVPGFQDASSRLGWLDIQAERGALQIPLDRQGAVFVPYRGPRGSFRYVSASDVLAGRVDPSVLAGRIVLVGTTAPGLMDLRSTPVGSAFPGVEVHASLIAGMLDGSLKAVPENVAFLESLQLLLGGLFLIICLPRLSPLRASCLALGLMGLGAAVNFILWRTGGLVFPLASWLLLLVLLFVFNMSWGYFVEASIRRQFATLFGQYVPPALVDKMSQNPESYNMLGRSDELTVLFADLREFTRLAEGMSPRQVGSLMNEYFGEMTEIIGQQQGTLDKYIGDAIMAFWGAPVADPAHARHAVLAALAMQSRLQDLAESFQARGWPVLTVGIGINSGQMLVGDMGSKVRKAYTVMGDAVNLASRLEEVTKIYGVPIVVGEATYRQAGNIVFRELDRICVKGKLEVVSIYEPVGEAAAISSETLAELAQWARGLQLYRDRQWAAAGLIFAELCRQKPGSRLYALYAARAIEFAQHPPGADWGGVTLLQGN